MAYIYKRGKKWAFRAYAGKDPITGKNKQKSKSGFRTKKDAQLAANIFERQFQSGEYVEQTQLSIEELSHEWLKHYSSQVKRNTVIKREIALKIIIEEFKNKPVQRITKLEYQAFIDKLGGKYSRSYVMGIHSTCKLMFQYALDYNIIKNNPTENIKLPKNTKTVDELKNENINDKFFEKEELKEFLLVAKNEGLSNDFAAFSLLAYTGLRIGELIVLQWDDVDFTNNTINIYKTYFSETNRKGEYQFTTPKTEKSVRLISIDPVISDILKEHKQQQQQWKIRNHAVYHDAGFVFPGNDGYPRTVKHFNSRMARILEKTTIGKALTPHSFRHTHTALLIESGAHIKEIQERLGHSDINVTLSIYAHLTKDKKEEASSRFSNLMVDISNDIL